MQTSNQLDVIGIGNAIVDTLASGTEDFLTNQGLPKGGTTLVDPEEAARISKSIGAHTSQKSGGSVANSMAGIALLGGTGSYVGKVHDDELGLFFRSDLNALGINFDTHPLKYGPPTAQCLVIVTPDGQRTMATYLGASTNLSPEDIDAETIKTHKITYLEGYLWDTYQAKKAMIKAANLSHNTNGRVALSLSDVFCIERHRDSLRDLIPNHIDILFGNEEEIKSLYQETDLKKSLDLARAECDTLVVTLGHKGSLVANSDTIYPISPAPIESVVDTTGAGDLYAAGFLFGITHGYDIESSGRIGSFSASFVLGHMGGRPESDLKSVLFQAL